MINSLFKTLSIAVYTVKYWVRNKIYYGFIIASFVFIGFAVVSGYLTERVKDRVFINTNIFFIEMILIFTAVFISATTVIKDIKEKEVYYILSKPVSKINFILGRYLGYLIAIIAINILLTAVLAVLAKIMSVNFGYVNFLNLIYILSLKIAFICALGTLFSSYSTSYISAILLTAASILIFEFNEGVIYWITYSDVSGLTAELYRVIFYILPNFNYYNIYQQIEITPDLSLRLYFIKLFFYTLSYTVFFLIVSVISFKKRDL